ncbi:hypothetical protein GGR57DRAFT_517902 [Xylariaceae sp. FL1272]|nr:hypothetical protein GGR57DRAFT_517902 [Xylariaceae sp. FL1272]
MSDQSRDLTQGRGAAEDRLDEMSETLNTIQGSLENLVEHELQGMIAEEAMQSGAEIQGFIQELVEDNAEALQAVRDAHRENLDAMQRDYDDRLQAVRDSHRLSRNKIRRKLKAKRSIINTLRSEKQQVDEELAEAKRQVSELQDDIPIQVAHETVDLRRELDKARSEKAAADVEIVQLKAQLSQVQSKLNRVVRDKGAAQHQVQTQAEANTASLVSMADTLRLINEQVMGADITGRAARVQQSEAEQAERRRQDLVAMKKDVIIEKRDMTIEEKDRIIQEKDAIIRQKDSALAAQARELAMLTRQFIDMSLQVRREDRRDDPMLET